MKPIRFLPGFALVLALATPAAAQLSVEIRGGGAIGNHAPAAAGLETVAGLALSAAVEMSPVRFASLYAGYTRASFGCEEGFCTGRDVTFTSSGFGAGARLHLPRLPWVRAGVLYHALDTRADGGEHTADPGLGYELGAGATVPLSPRIRLLPGLVYRRHGTTTDGVGDTDTTSLLSAEVGLQIAF
jgi:hypothetical protein